MWLLVVLGCANNIKTLYENEKKAVMASPAALGKNWQPELRVRFGDGALSDISEVALKSGLLQADKKLSWEGPFGVTAELTPKLVVRDLKLNVAQGCDGCLKLAATLDGKGAWDVSGVTGEVPITLTVDGTIGFEVKQDDGAFTVTGRLKDFEHIKVKTGKASDLDLGGVLQSWAKDIAERTPEIELGTFGGDEMGLRALRIGSSGGALAIEAVTDVAGAKPLTGGNTPLQSDWDIAISESAALALMRRMAFEEGVIDYDVAADPRSLSVSGSRFTMGLRLWRLTSRGWWRDYTVTGDFKVTNNKIKLVPAEVKEGEKSAGAGLADPLALLAEGAILDAVAGGLAESFPSGEGTEVGGQKVQARATAILGMGSALVVRGDLDVGDAATSSGSGDDDEPDAETHKAQDHKRRRAAPRGR